MRATSSSLLLFYLVQSVWVYELPDPEFRVYRKGFEVSIGHRQGMTYFYFRAQRNFKDGETWSGAVHQYNDEWRWVYKNVDAELKLGDTLECWLSVTRGTRRYTKEVRHNVVKICEEITAGDPGTTGVEKTAEYVIPDPIFKVYDKGFEVSIPHTKGIQSLHLRARNSKSSYIWSSAVFTYDVNKRWTYKNINEELRLGDSLICSISVTKNGNTYYKNVLLSVAKISGGSTTNDSGTSGVEITPKHALPEPATQVYGEDLSVSMPHEHGIETVNIFDELKTQAVGADDVTLVDECSTYEKIHELPENLTPLPYFRIYRKGFDASIPHEEGMEYFVFTAHRKAFCEIYSGFVTKYDENGHWTYSNRDAQLQLGDTLDYTIAVGKNGICAETSCVFTVLNYESPYDGIINLFELY